MPKTIEFRAKHKNPYGDKWVYGYYALEDGEHVIIMPHSNSYEAALKDNNALSPISIKHVIDYDTLGQSTGLKDIQGNIIFEGDIIQLDKELAKTFQLSELGYIVFNYGSFRYKNKGVNGLISTLEAICNLNGLVRGVVIGNIYDNKDLLED